MTISIVQHGGSNTNLVTFGTAPTNGNLLLCAFLHWSNSPTANSGDGWAALGTTNINGGTGDGVAWFYKYAGASESNVQLASGASGTALQEFMWEIAGVTGVIATDVPFNHGEVDKTAATSYTTTSFNTGQANTLILGAISGNVSIGTTEVAPTLSGGSGNYANDDTNTDNGNGTRHAGAQSFHDVLAGSGTAVSLTANFTQTQDMLARMTMVELANAAASATETGTGDIQLGQITMAGAGVKAHELGTGGVNLGKVVLGGAGALLKSAGTGLRQFWTFGG